MKRFSVALFALFAALVVTGFSGDEAPAGEERVLHIYTWADYFDSDVLDQFQKKYDCEVVLDIFDSNENLLKTLKVLKGNFDVLTPSSYMAAALYREGHLAELDHALIPNLKYLTPSAIDLGDDPDMRYSIPYSRSITGIGYSKKNIPESAIGSWDIFDNASSHGKATALTDMRECVGAALKLLGFSLNTANPDEIAAAGDVILRWKRNVELLDSEAGKAGLVDGKYSVVQNYNGDMLQVMMDDPDIGFFIPREGTSVTTDDFAIASDTPMRELAHAFINHMLDPDMAQQNMDSVFFYMPNESALAKLPPEIRDSPAFNVSLEQLENCEVIKDVGEEANAIYERVWEDVLERKLAGSL